MAKTKPTTEVLSSAPPPKSSKPVYFCKVNLFDPETNFEYMPRALYVEDKFILKHAADDEAAGRTGDQCMFFVRQP